VKKNRERAVKADGKRWKTIPTEPVAACELEIPATRFGGKPHLPSPQKSEFEKDALFSVSLGKR
jgi:hypothetical protein